MRRPLVGNLILPEGSPPVRVREIRLSPGR
jgi:hypothetical protein